MTILLTMANCLRTWRKVRSRRSTVVSTLLMMIVQPHTRREVFQPKFPSQMPLPTKLPMFLLAPIPLSYPRLSPTLLLVLIPLHITPSPQWTCSNKETKKIFLDTLRFPPSIALLVYLEFQPLRTLHKCLHKPPHCRSPTT